MAKSSPLARVIGFTRSFTPLLNVPDGSDETEATDAPAMARTTEVEVAPEVAIATRSGLRRLRVAAWSDAARSAAASTDAGTSFDGMVPKPEAPIEETAESIEADIASLLATMSQAPELDQVVSSASDEAAEDEGPVRSIEQLLEELDRQWRADGDVRGDRLH